MKRIGFGRAAASASIGGMGVPLCIAVLGEFLGTVTPAEKVLFAAVMFALILVSLVLGGRRGLFVVWGLMVVLWTMGLLGATEEGSPELREIAVRLPSRFTAWSFVAFPLAVATAFFLGRPSRPMRWRGSTPVLGIWLGLLVGTAHLASYAPDVGATPLQAPLVVWAAGILLPPVPLFLCGWSMLQLREREFG